MVIEEPTQFGGDGTVLSVTSDEESDVINTWNHTSRSSVLVMHASGRHSNQCGRGLTVDVLYTAVGKSHYLHTL